MSTHTEYGPGPDRPEPPGSATGGILFAGCTLLLIGSFQAISGFVAIFNDDFYVKARHYTFDLDVSAWGWIHLVIGLAIVATAIGLLAGKVLAGILVLVLAVLSAIANFLFIPYYPFWSILVIALNVWVIWSITRPGAMQT